MSKIQIPLYISPSSGLFFISPDEDLLFEVETSRVNFLVSFNSDDQRNTDVATIADVTTYINPSHQDEPFQSETKIAEKNQQMITQIVELLANKDNKDDKEMGTQMAKAVTDVLSQYGIVKNKDGQSLDSIKESLVEIKERNDDSEFRGQPNIRHFDVGLKIDVEDWIEKYKDAMSDKKASIEKQVSQLKLLTDGAVNAWVKD